ncbi:odorant receptor 30a [Ooceraea biroi]|nr:odorant receptor 30a [Ooceraea biroi]
MIEAFIICFAGEYLCLKSKSIADAAYESLWYDIPPDHVKIILFMIMRSQRGLAITAGRITNLSLEAFASIMKASVSYISVLHAMY